MIRLTFNKVTGYVSLLLFFPCFLFANSSLENQGIINTRAQDKQVSNLANESNNKRVIAERNRQVADSSNVNIVKLATSDVNIGQEDGSHYENTSFYYDERRMREDAEKRANRLQNEVKELIHQEGMLFTVSDDKNTQKENNGKREIAKEATLEENSNNLQKKSEFLSSQVISSIPADINSLQVDETIIDTLINQPAVSGHNSEAIVETLINVKTHSDLLSLSQAANKGDSQAQYELGKALLLGSDVTKKDNKQAIQWLQKAVNQKHVEAMMLLAECYQVGDGVERDLQKSFYLYQSAADKGNSIAQRQAAIMLFGGGAGVKVDNVAAFKWAKRAADNGDVTAMALIGEGFLQGRGVNKNIQQSLYWLQKAARKQEPTAMLNLSAFYLDKTNHYADMTKAVYWLTQAAKAKSASGQLQLASLYGDRAIFGQPDYQQAYAWAAVAARNGQSEAQQRMTLYLKKLSATDLQKAKILANRYIELYSDRS